MRLAAGTLTESTVHDYTHSMALWAPLRRVRLEQLTAADVDRRLEQLRTTPTSRGPGYSASKRRGALVAFRQAFKAGRRAGLVPPGRSAPENAITPSVRRPTPPLVTPEIAAAVLAELVDDRDLRAVLVTLSLGLRISETLGLTWDCIDLDTATIRIHQQLRRTRDRRGTLAPTKTKNNDPLALPRLGVDALREQRRVQAEQRLAAGPYWSDPVPDLVFRRADGNPLWASNITTKVGNACDAVTTTDPALPLKVPRMGIHAFARHGHATLLILQGGPLDDVRDNLRHAQVSTSLIYAHVLPQVRRRTADMMDRVLDGLGW